ncbi:MAG: hypothetical protein PHH26_00450 [Candidatus Thermoplasmatota archaeon]|nr:hypothetical protein [Candidatus Thermoplasmatota archaeon]
MTKSIPDEMADMFPLGFSEKSKPNYIGGHRRRIHCAAKKWAGGRACDCGQYGKKNLKAPYYVKLAALDGQEWALRYEARCKKWRIHEEIRNLQKFST